MSLTVTVSQINRRLALIVKGDKTLQDICVKGEISNFVNHYKTGHLYFSLKDEEASIKVVMFRSSAEKLLFEPENGMNVIVRGNVQVFERDGACQLYAADIQPDGLGGIYLAFEQLKEKLGKEGLFDRKRPLPTMPACIAIITSKGAAALQDMLNILGRRDPLVKVKLIPALVQGVDAPQSLVEALNKAQNTGADLIIIGRGGGSVEDLQAFNNENVARAIFASEIPTISAVGHETDFTIADFVADLRAPTPSAAAELAVPDMTAVRDSLPVLQQNLREKVLGKISSAEERLEAIVQRLRLLAPEAVIKRSETSAEQCFAAIESAYKNVIERKSSEFDKQAELLAAKNPMNTLSRGYAMVTLNGKAVSSSESLNEGDIVDVRLGNGSFTAEIKTIRKGKDVENDF